MNKYNNGGKKMMFIVDDYHDGKIYLGDSMADLENVLPKNILCLVLEMDVPYDHHKNWKHKTLDTDNSVYFYFGLIKDKKILKYMRMRDCMNAIVGV